MSASRRARGPGRSCHGVSVTSDRMSSRLVRSDAVAVAICKASSPAVAASSGSPESAKEHVKRARTYPWSRWVSWPVASACPYKETYAKLRDELCDHVADLRVRQFLIMLSRGFA